VVFDLRDSNIYRLRYYLALCSWDNVYSCVDINVKFQNFVNILLILMSQCIPARVVRLGKRDPSFVTALVRTLLNRRRTLRRSGRLTDANALAEKNIIILLAKCRQSHLMMLLLSLPGISRKLWATTFTKFWNLTLIST